MVAADHGSRAPARAPRTGGTLAAGFVLVMTLVLAAARPAAADIELHARIDTSQVRVGRVGDLAIEATGAQDVPAPQVPAQRGLTIRYVGPSTQLSIVNGRTNASITHHFSVVAQSPGTYAIGPITIDYQGKRYDAGNVTVEVLPSAAPAGNGRAGEELLRLTLVAPKTDVYLHERMPLKIQLVVGAVRVTDVEFPTLDGEGFSVEKFGQPAQHEDRSASGSTVQVAEFTTTLTPLRSGQLTVGPARLGLNTIVRGRGGDPFFGQFFGGSRESVDLASDPLVLNVMPLPDAGKPPDFSGAVGKFEFDVRAAPLDVQAGDPITVTTTMRGTGNLEHVTPPVIPEAEGLRVYAPQPANAGATPIPSVRGEEKAFEQVVIPEQPGAFAIPELRFSYFDPDTRAYRTITHPAIPITIRAAAQSAKAPQIIGAPPVARPAESLGRDIVFIKDTPGALRPIGTRWYRSAAFWAFQLLPLAAWLALVAYDRRRRRLHGDTGYARYTRAGREARTALAAARAALGRGDRGAFYDAVASALRDYLSAKLDLPPGSVTPERVGERLGRNALAERIPTELRDLFDHCEHVRFAPSADGDRDMPATLERAEGIVRQLERARRLAPPLAASIVALIVGVAALAALAGTRAAGAAEGNAPAPSTADNPSALFFQANGLYSSERYADAAATYEKILAAGRESGNLYFNLGNAYFRSGDLGRAILEYERARRLIPGDPDLRANLTFAQTAAGTAEDEPVYARLLFPLASRVSTDGLLLAASAGYVLVILVLILGRFVPPAERTAKATAIVVALGSVVVASSGVYRLMTIDVPRYAVVVAPNETTVRFEPSSGGTAHYTTKNGAVLRMLAERGEWVQVARGDGQRGWVERAALEGVIGDGDRRRHS